MSSGEAFRRELRKAQADQHKAQRNRRGKRPRGLERADFGRTGFVIPPAGSNREIPNKDSRGQERKQPADLEG